MTKVAVAFTFDVLAIIGSKVRRVAEKKNMKIVKALTASISLEREETGEYFCEFLCNSVLKEAIANAEIASIKVSWRLFALGMAGLS